MYDFKSHNRKESFRGRGNYKEFYKTDYSLKIYNKSKQFRLKENILRVEFKVTRRRLLNRLGIYSLEDLNQSNCLSLFNAFLERFDKLIILDSLSVTNDNNKTKNDLLKDGLNSDYWLFLNSDKTRNTIYHKKQKFRKLLEGNYPHKTKESLRNSLILKFNELINCSSSDYLQQSA